MERQLRQLEEEKGHVHQYKDLLLRQRDIMVALTSKLNERDEAIMHLQEELEAYDKIYSECETLLRIKTEKLNFLENFLNKQPNCDLEAVWKEFEEGGGVLSDLELDIQSLIAPNKQKRSSRYAGVAQSDNDIIQRNLKNLVFNQPAAPQESPLKANKLESKSSPHHNNPCAHPISEFTAPATRSEQDEHSIYSQPGPNTQNQDQLHLNSKHQANSDFSRAKGIAQNLNIMTPPNKAGGRFKGHAAYQNNFTPDFASRGDRPDSVIPGKDSIRESDGGLGMMRTKIDYIIAQLREKKEKKGLEMVAHDLLELQRLIKVNADKEHLSTIQGQSNYFQFLFDWCKIN